MGRDLQAHQGIPIGLISAAWGGSFIEDWISGPALGTIPRYRGQLDLLSLYARDHHAGEVEWGRQLTAWLGKRLTPPAPWAAVPNLTHWEEWGVSDLADFDGIVYYRAPRHLERSSGRQGQGRPSGDGRDRRHGCRPRQWHRRRRRSGLEQEARLRCPAACSMPGTM
jgi:sialate O-acetylesterase